MAEDLAVAAEAALEAALAETGARDPRVFYRARLKDLKQASPEAYEAAVAYYRGTLIPRIANGESAPLHAWTEYGRVLAESLAPGRTVSVDQTGLAAPYDGPDQRSLILHLPTANGARALLVGLPTELSAAQRATYDVLVEGRQRLPA